MILRFFEFIKKKKGNSLKGFQTQWENTVWEPPENHGPFW
jgi:hypothetical protein